MKKIFLILLILSNLNAFAQRNSQSVKDKELYGANTKWSCIDKHFGYYFINYANAIPINNTIENAFGSGIFSAGYTYRYKIVKPFDIGLELAYQNRLSKIKNEKLSIFDPSKFYDKILTYHNYINSGLYFRFNIAESSYRKLGYYFELGASFSYAFSYGTKYKLNNSFLNQKAKFKKPYYQTPIDYTLFFRAGFNNVAVFIDWHFDEWINDFKNENLFLKRTPLMVGIQLNFYTK